MNVRIQNKIDNARRRGKNPGVQPTDAHVTDQRASAEQNPAAKTGPKTQDGKAAVRLSAYKHGLCGQGLVVPPPELPAYRTFSKGFIDRYQPADFVERQALQKIIEANWKFHIATGIENNLLNASAAQSGAGQSADEDLNAILGKVDAWVNNSEEFERFSRYALRWSREADRLLKHFRELQMERRMREYKPSAAYAMAAGQSGPSPQADSAALDTAAENAYTCVVPASVAVEQPHGLDILAAETFVAEPLEMRGLAAQPVNANSVVPEFPGSNGDTRPAARLETVRCTPAPSSQGAENTDTSLFSELFGKKAFVLSESAVPVPAEPALEALHLGGRADGSAGGLGSAVRPAAGRALAGTLPPPHPASGANLPFPKAGLRDLPRAVDWLGLSVPTGTTAMEE